MIIQEPLGHAPLIRDLWRAAAQGRLGHALLFEGPEGIGKFEAAKWFAQGLLCSAGPLVTGADAPCGRCPGCKKLVSGGTGSNHPDILVIDRAAELAAGADGGPALSIGHIAARSGEDRRGGVSVEEFLNLKASEGGYRVVLLREAERLSEAAQNALLKTLEEPALGTFLVLESSAPQELLTTLKSRMLRARFSPLEPQNFARWVHGAADIDRTAAERWSGMASGSPGRLRAFLERGGPELCALWWRVLSASSRDPERPSTADFLGVEGRFEAATELGKRRERVVQSLEVLATLLRELWLSAQGLEDPSGGLLAGLEGAQASPAEALRLGLGRLESLLLAVGQGLADLSSNLDPEATLERALAKLE